MHRSTVSARKLSQSRSRRSQAPVVRTTAVDLLHSGLRRKISMNDYASIFPKMKISRTRDNDFNSVKQSYTE